MRSPSYPEDVILTLLKEADDGTPIGQVCKTAAISTRTFYRWRAQYGGLSSSAARERNELIRENLRLRALVEALLRKEKARGNEADHALVMDTLAPREPTTGRFGALRGKR